MAEHTVPHPAHNVSSQDPAPSRSVVYAVFAILAILFIAVIAYSFTQFSSMQQQLNRVAPAADRLAGIDARLTQLEGSGLKTAQFQLLYDSSCTFCDNNALLSDADSWNYDNEPKGMKLVPVDVSGKLDQVRKSNLPFLPTVLVLDAEARRNGYSWDLVNAQGASGPVFARISGAFYGALSTAGQPRPVQLTGPDCKVADKLTVDYFYGLRCPQCVTMQANFDALKKAMGDQLVVREHCTPLAQDEAAACVKKEGAESMNQTARLIESMGVSYAPTTVFDCSYSQSSSSLTKIADRICAIRPEFCDKARAAAGSGASTPAANTTIGNVTVSNATVTNSTAPKAGNSTR